MLAGTTPDSNSIHYHTHCGRTLVYQVNDVSEYGIKLSSAQVSARTETLITDTYYAEEHVLTRPETSEIIPPKLCHQLPSTIQEPMGNCVHPSSKAVNNVFPYTKEIHETAKMPCDDQISQHYSYHPTIEKEHMDYDHDFYNYESHFKETGNLIDGVDDTFAVNEEFANVLEETDSVFEEHNDDTIEDTCTITDDKVQRIVGIVTRHADTRDTTPTLWSPNDDGVEETGIRTPTEHSYHNEYQFPGSSSYDCFVFDNSEQEIPIKADFQLPSIFSNRSKTSSVERLGQNKSTDLEQYGPSDDPISTKDSVAPEETMITSSIDSPQNADYTTQEPKTVENSVLVNMIEDYVKMVMEASRELNHSAKEETPQEFASGFPSSSYSSAANTSDVATNSHKLDISDRIENETFNRDTGKTEIENAGIESEMNKNHETETALILADQSVSSPPEIESSDEDSDSCSINTIVEVSGKDQRLEPDSPVTEKGGFLPVAPRKSSVEKWESVTLKSELGHENKEEESQFFRESKLKLVNLKSEYVGKPEKDCQERDKQLRIDSESFLNFIADENQAIITEDTKGSLVHKHGNSTTANHVGFEELFKNSIGTSHLPNNDGELEIVITSETENIKKGSSESQNTRSEEVENEPIYDPEKIHSDFGEEDVKEETENVPEIIESTLLENGSPHHDARINECVLNSKSVSGEIHESLTENNTFDELADSIPTDPIITAVENSLEDNSYNESEIIDKEALNVVEKLLNVVKETSETEGNASNANETTRTRSGLFSSSENEVPCLERSEIENCCFDEVRACLEEIVEDICLKSSACDQEASPQENSQEDLHIDVLNETECSEFGTCDSEISDNNPSSSGIQDSHDFTGSFTIPNNLPSLSSEENDVTSLLDSDSSYQETRETKDSNEQSTATQREVLTFDKQLKNSEEDDLILGTELIVVNTSDVDVGKTETFQDSQSEISPGSSYTTPEKALDECPSAFSYQPVGGSSIGDGINLIDVIHCEPEGQKLFVSRNQEEVETSCMLESVGLLESRMDTYPELDDTEMTDVKTHLGDNSSSSDELLQNIDDIQQLEELEQELNFDPDVEEFLNSVISKLEDNSTTSNEMFDRSILSERTDAVTTETLDFSFVSDFEMEIVEQEYSVIPVETVPFECVEQAKCLEQEEMFFDFVRDLLDTIEMREDVFETLENIIEGATDFVNQENMDVVDTIVLATFEKNSECKGEDDGDVGTSVDYLLNAIDEMHRDGNSESSRSNNTEIHKRSTNPFVECDETNVELIQELLVSVSQIPEKPNPHNSLKESSPTTPSTENFETIIERQAEMCAELVTCHQSDMLENQKEDDSIQELVEYLLGEVDSEPEDLNDGQKDILKEEKLPAEKNINKEYQEDISDVLGTILLAVVKSSDEDDQLTFGNSPQSVEDVADVFEILIKLVCSGSENQETGNGSIGQRTNSDSTTQDMLTGNNENQGFEEKVLDEIEGLMNINLEHSNCQENTSIANNSMFTADNSRPMLNSDDLGINNPEMRKVFLAEVEDHLEQILQGVCLETEIPIEESQSNRKLAFEDGISNATEMCSSSSNDDQTDRTTTAPPNCQVFDENTILDATPEINEILQSIIEELLQNSLKSNYANQEMDYRHEEFIDTSQNSELDVFEDSGFCDASVSELDSIDVSHSCSNLVDNISCPVFYDFGDETELPHGQKNTDAEQIGDQNDEDGMGFVTTKEAKDDFEGNHQVVDENNVHDTPTPISNLYAISDVEIRKENYLKEGAEEEELPLVTSMENVSTMEEEKMALKNDERNLEKVCFENERDVVISDSFKEEETDKVCLDYNSNGIGISCEEENSAELCSLEFCFTEGNSNACSCPEAASSHSPEVVENLPKSEMNIATLIDRYVGSFVQDQLCIALSNATGLISDMYIEQLMDPETHSQIDMKLNLDYSNISEEASIFMTPVGTILKTDVENVVEIFEVSYGDNLDFHNSEAFGENAEKGDQFLETRCVRMTDDMIAANSEAVRTFVEENHNTRTIEEELPAESVENMSNFVQLSCGSTENAFESLDVQDNTIEKGPESETSSTDHLSIQDGLPTIYPDRELDHEMSEFEKPLFPDPKTTQLEHFITTQNAPTIKSDIEHKMDVIIETANVLHHSSSDNSQETRISKGETSDDCDDTNGSKIKHLNGAETSKHENTEYSTPTLGTELLILSSDVTLQNVRNSHPKHNECNDHEDIFENVPTNTSQKLPVETYSTESSLKSLEPPSTSSVMEEVSHFLTTACVVALAFVSPSESASSSFNPDIIEDVSKYFSEEDANDADKI